MKTTKTVVFTVFMLYCFFITNIVSSQSGNDVFTCNTSIQQSDSNRLYLTVENTNLFKNNEFFTDFEKGYTIFGFFLRPMLSYHPTSNTKIETGVHLLKYSGKDDFEQALPVFRFQYRINKYLDFVMGTLYGGANHKLSEPLYRFERHFTDHVENGAQLLFYSNRVRSDLWINWEKFILRDDPFQEEFVVGNTTEIFITNPFKAFTVSVPLQLLAAHKGGQIDNSDDELLSIANLAGGISLQYKLYNHFITSIGLNTNYITYSDISHTRQMAFKNGYGIYPKLWAYTKLIDLEIGYWRANRFIAPRGEPLFQSVSNYKTEYTEEDREIFTGRFTIHKNIGRNIDFGLRFGSYYDVINSSFDFYYQVHLVFNQRFFLTRPKRNLTTN